MPKSIHGKPLSEHKWEKAKQISKAKGKGWDYTMGIAKTMLNIKSQATKLRGKKDKHG